MLVTDALCYSTTDIFAAGFQDHKIGTILGIDNNTGAGGANVWTHSWLSQHLPDFGYQNLPSNAGMRVSMRRTVRVGQSNGTILEDFGVVPDVLHPMTKADLLNNNVDLLTEAVDLLNDMPLRQLDAATVVDSGDGPGVVIKSIGIDRVDLYDGDRPIGSIDVDDEPVEVALDNLPTSSLRLVGFDSGEMVVNRVLNFQA